MKLYHRTIGSMYLEVTYALYDLIDDYGDSGKFEIPDIVNEYIGFLSLAEIQKAKEENGNSTVLLISTKGSKAYLKDIGLENAVYLYECIEAALIMLTYNITSEKTKDGIRSAIKDKVSELEGKSITVKMDYIDIDDFGTFAGRLATRFNEESEDDDEDKDMSESMYHDSSESSDDAPTITMSFEKIDDKLALKATGSVNEISIFTEYMSNYELLSLYDLFHKNLKLL